MDPNPALPVNGPDPSRSSGALAPANRPAAGRPTVDTESASPAFHVLLDRLEEQARSLTERSEALDRPEKLAGAVDAARDSLESALSLGDQLVEAYRASVQRGDTGRGEGE